MNIIDIQQANAAKGGHYFDAATMRFFRSRVLNTVYQGGGGVFFVTSEKGPHDDSPRMYTVREYHPATADVSTAGIFNELTKAQAQRRAKQYAEGTRTPSEDKH